MFATQFLDNGSTNFNKKHTNWCGRQNAVPLKFDRKPKEVALFSAVFSNFEKCRPEVADDVISGVATEQVGVDLHVKFGDSIFNSGRTI